MTTLHHQPTGPWRNTSSCCLQTHGLAAETTDWCSHSRPLPMQQPFNTGWRKPNCQSPSEPHHLVESVLELRWVMELMVSFTDEEVLTATAPSNWVEVPVSRLAEPASADPHHSHSHSHSHNTQAHPRGSLMAAHGRDQPAVTKKRDKPVTLPQEVMTQL